MQEEVIREINQETQNYNLRVNFFILGCLTCLMVHVAKIIEIIGSSDKGWEDAAQVAVDEAKRQYMA